MAATNTGGSGAAALHALRMLARTAARTLRAFLHGVPRPQPARAGRSAPAPPAGAMPQAEPARRVTAPRGDEAAPASGDSARDEPQRAYGQSRIVLVARDPWSLFAHWDIPPIGRLEELRALGPDGEHAQEVLRLHEVAASPPTFRDLVLAPGAGRAHVDGAHPARSYRVEVGLRAPSGRFVPLATSNVVSTPAAGPSDDTSVCWVAPGPGGAAPEVAVAWSGRRVLHPASATSGGPAPRPAPAGGSSEAMPPGRRASDALPIR